MPIIACIIVLYSALSFAAEGAITTDTTFIVRRDRLEQISCRVEALQQQAVQRILEQPDRIEQQIARLRDGSQSTRPFILASLQRNLGSLLFDIAAAQAWSTALEISMLETDIEYQIRHHGGLAYTTCRIVQSVLKGCLESRAAGFRFPADRSGMVDFLDQRGRVISNRMFSSGINLAATLSMLHAMLESDRNVVEVLSH